MAFQRTLLSLPKEPRLFRRNERERERETRKRERERERERDIRGSENERLKKTYRSVSKIGVHAAVAQRAGDARCAAALALARFPV